MEQQRGEVEQADQSMVEVENREKPEVKIINMTGHEMSQGELNLCRKGLGFTPVPRDNVPELRVVRGVTGHACGHTLMDDITMEQNTPPKTVTWRWGAATNPPNSTALSNHGRCWNP